MIEQICHLGDGFIMYETDPGAYGYVSTSSPDMLPKTEFCETAMFISRGKGHWDLFLTSRGLFYIARIALKLNKTPRPQVFSLATMSYVKSRL